MNVGYDINELYQEAQTRWLKPPEVLFILQNHERCRLTEEPLNQPTSGSLFLFNKRVLRFFRKDGHNWRKKRDGRTVGEAHERLKVGNAEALNCYYAHGEHNPNFQRRCYWMLDPSLDYIVLVHYRDINEGRPGTGCVPRLSSRSSSTHSFYSSQNLVSTSEHCHTSSSPGSVEVSSNTGYQINGIDSMDGRCEISEFKDPNESEVSQALRRIEEQLSLTEDNLKDIGPFYIPEEVSNPDLLNYYDEMSHKDQFSVLQHPESAMYNNNYSPFEMQDGNGKYHHHDMGHDFIFGGEGSKSWHDTLDSSKTSNLECQERHTLLWNGNDKPSSSSSKGRTAEHGYHDWLNSTGKNTEEKSSLFIESCKTPGYSSVVDSRDVNVDYYTPLFKQDHVKPLGVVPKFTIHQVVPEWCYATEPTKVVIIGSFLCDPSESPWHCMFGDIEVPLQIVQNGVLCCEAPPRLPGKVALCITSGNRKSCSEVREFEYRANINVCHHCRSRSGGAMKSPEELLLLVRLVQVLLSYSSIQKYDNVDSRAKSSSTADDDQWSSMIEALLEGSETSSDTTDWLLQELLKDKLYLWLSSQRKGSCDAMGSSLSRKEQGIIHMIAGLGYVWALNPILSCGVNINFRDINGWTALHWAARFGREKMVAALIASGASAGAVTDPSSQDPVGKNAASLADIHGHKGLAGYLSEVALTSHLSSLTLEESELSKGSAELEAEMTVNSISKGNLSSEDYIPLKTTLAAVRNAAQAAARIQSAFRAHSFRKRQQKEATQVACVDEYGFDSDEIQGLLAMSKFNISNRRDCNAAALSIQKKYRGWKGRKEFLSIRQKVVKIQAHVRGYQVRKHYKIICWAVGILDKVVLRWRRKGAGLRGFRSEKESIDESEDDDIIKVFRKQKVEGTIGESVSRVLSMVDSPDARQQYIRMLEGFQEAKAKLDATSNETAEASTSFSDVYGMEDYDDLHSKVVPKQYL